MPANEFADNFFSLEGEHVLPTTESPLQKSKNLSIDFRIIRSLTLSLLWSLQKFKPLFRWSALPISDIPANSLFSNQQNQQKARKGAEFAISLLGLLSGPKAECLLQLQQPGGYLGLEEDAFEAEH